MPFQENWGPKERRDQVSYIRKTVISAFSGQIWRRDRVEREADEGLPVVLDHEHPVDVKVGYWMQSVIPRASGGKKKQ